jgi:hypothetical protein
MPRRPGVAQHRVAVGAGLGHARLQRRNRQPRLEAADLAAHASRAAVGADGDVTDLSGGEPAAGHGLTTREQARPDAAADADQQHVVGGSAEGVLREHGRIGVVGDEHRQPQVGTQSAFQVDALPSEVRRRENDAAIVHDAGAADADAEDRRVRVGHEATRELHDGAEDVGGVRRYRHVPTRDDLSVEREDRAEESVGAREVQPDDAVALPIEVDEDRGLSGPSPRASRARRRSRRR